ncbi:MerR family transcriptional regulator [Anaplasmataceae bacterium AB001_6]|nr:MerR family transcriptional regulator [Anaplasmataceae bacterium AB001_6]
MMRNIIDKISLDDKIFKNIAEVSKELNLEKYVIRFWEKEFPMLNPKRYKGVRYYSPDDIKLLKKIVHLLYEKKYTIKGAKDFLSARRSGELYNSLLQINKRLESIYYKIKDNKK